jgi:hypothetical protein
LVDAGTQDLIIFMYFMQYGSQLVCHTSGDDMGVNLKFKKNVNTTLVLSQIVVALW